AHEPLAGIDPHVGSERRSAAQTRIAHAVEDRQAAQIAELDHTVPIVMPTRDGSGRPVDSVRRALAHAITPREGESDDHESGHGMLLPPARRRAEDAVP